jgi:vacuolar iron transporter family protein
MSLADHHEKHFQGGDTVKDIVIGMADGLTVPFALAAGIFGAVAQTHLVVTAGFAEIAAAKSDLEHFQSEQKREEEEIKEKPQAEAKEIIDLFQAYGLTAEEIGPVVEGLKRRPTAWRDFMMKFELGLEEPDPSRAIKSAITIAGAYITGGLIPLLPYVLIGKPAEACLVSACVTLLVLFIFGMVKGKFTGASPLKSGAQTILVGGLAAGAAYGLAKLIYEVQQRCFLVRPDPFPRLFPGGVVATLV